MRRGSVDRPAIQAVGADGEGQPHAIGAKRPEGAEGKPVSGRRKGKERPVK
jgi:hypothetical protein